MFCYTDEKFHAFVPHVQWNTTVRPSVVEQIDDSIWKGRKWLEEQWFVQHVDDTGITCFFVFLVQNMFCCEYEKFYVLLDMLYTYNENMVFFVAKTCFVTQMRIFMFCMTCCTHTQVARVYSIAFIYIYGCILLGKVHSMLLTCE
jgi:hypothetical protein